MRTSGISCAYASGVFRLWLLETFGCSWLKARDAVDVGGGRGLLAYILFTYKATFPRYSLCSHSKRDLFVGAGTVFYT